MLLALRFSNIFITIPQNLGNINYPVYFHTSLLINYQGRICVLLPVITFHACPRDKIYQKRTWKSVKSYVKLIKSINENYYY